jgi:hypothetical protein
MRKLLLTILLFVISVAAFSENQTVRQVQLYYGDQVIFSREVALVDSMNFSWVEANHHDFVDLGLSVKWATCNIGAEKPEEYGDYFAWGEVEPKSVYDNDSYKWYKGSPDQYTKYTVADETSDEQLSRLSAEDDAAAVNWGGAWRMPTQSELEELINQCSWEWKTLNGVNGYEVRGRNGNSIFIPAAGCKYDNILYSEGSYGSCWSSTLSNDSTSYAYELGFYSIYTYIGYYKRSCGQSVRAVCP